MPKTDTGRKWPTYELKKIALQDGVKLLPIVRSARGFSYVRAEDGWGMYAGNLRDSQEVDSIAFAFETGEIWSIDTALLSSAPEAMFSAEIENSFASAMRDYDCFLHSLGIKPPYLWIAGIVGVKGRFLNYPAKPGSYRIGPGPKCLADEIEARGTYDGQQSPTTTLLPFFEKIFEKCGLPRPDYLPR